MDWPPVLYSDVRKQAEYQAGGDFFRPGYYHAGSPTSTSTSTMTLIVNRLYMVPFHVPVKRSFDRIGVVVTSAGGAGAVLRLGVYANSLGYPGSLVVADSTVLTNTTGAKEMTISHTFDPGLHWIGVVAQVSACSMTGYTSVHSTPWGAFSQSAGTNPPNATAANFPYRDSTGGALPSPFSGASGGLSQVPLVGMRAA